MWEFLGTIFLNEGLVVVVLFILCGAIGWVLYQIFKANLQMKIASQKANTEQAKATTEAIQNHQASILETMTKISTRLESIEQELRADACFDTEYATRITKIVDELGEHSNDCTSANKEVLSVLNKRYDGLVNDLHNTLNLLTQKHEDLLKEIHTAITDIAICKDILQRGGK